MTMRQVLEESRGAIEEEEEEEHAGDGEGRGENDGSNAGVPERAPPPARWMRHGN